MIVLLRLFGGIVQYRYIHTLASGGNPSAPAVGAALNANGSSVGNSYTPTIPPSEPTQYINGLSIGDHVWVFASDSSGNIIAFVDHVVTASDITIP